MTPLTPPDSNGFDSAAADICQVEGCVRSLGKHKETTAKTKTNTEMNILTVE